MKIRCRAYAKLNLYLKIMDKRPDGYHNLSMIMQSISLYDELVFEPVAQPRVIVECHHETLRESNLIERAYNVLYQEYSSRIGNGYKVLLLKNIPMGAGLGGGSSDAAAMFKVMCRQYNLKIPKKKLIELMSRVGADVPFCFYGGTKLVEGIGDRLTNYNHEYKAHYLLIHPDIHLSTEEVYRIWDSQFDLSVEECCAEPQVEGTCNDFEKIIFPMYPELERIRDRLLHSGARRAMMTGSGSTIFGEFESKEACQKAADSFGKMKFSIVRPMRTGVSFQT